MLIYRTASALSRRHQPLADAWRAHTNAVVESSMSPSVQLELRSTTFWPSGFADICSVDLAASSGAAAEAQPRTTCATIGSSSRGVGDVGGDDEGDSDGDEEGETATVSDERGEFGNEGCKTAFGRAWLGSRHSPPRTISSNETASAPRSPFF